MPVPTSPKKAVLVGVCRAPKTDFGKVPGALENVTKLRELLINTYKYKPSDITILLDKDQSAEGKEFKADRLPTTKNILEAMQSLVSGRQSGDHIVFAFFGHGSQTNDTHDKNEKDGKDEFLVPSDWSGTTSDSGSEHPHLILDDEIRNIFVDQLQEGVHCTLIFDCCHSGTAGDLPEVHVGPAIEVDGKPSGVGEVKGSLSKLRARGFSVHQSLNHHHAANVPERAPETLEVAAGLVSKKEVTSWSACTDVQESFGGKMGGKFIDEFVQILQGQDGKTITNRVLLLRLRNNLKVVFDEANKGRAKPLVIPEPQLGSTRRDYILDEVFTL